MNAEDSPHFSLEQSENLGGKPTAPEIVSPNGKQSLDSQEAESDQTSNPPPLHNGKSNAQDDSLSLHSMVNGGHDEKSDEKPESTVSSLGGESVPPGEMNADSSSSVNVGEESVPPGEVKSDPSPSVNEDVSSEKDVSETSKPDPPLESSASSEPLPPDEATKVDSVPSEERTNLSSSVGEETLPSARTGEIDETEPETPAIQQETETQASTDELPGKKLQPSITGGIEEQMAEKDHAAQRAKEEISGDTSEPAQENPSLLTSLPTQARKESRFRTVTGVPRNEDLKAIVVIPSYLSKGMVNAIESAGVAYHEDPPRIKNIIPPESPILIFINSKSGGRLGPGLEALLVDIIAPTQVYDLSKCKPGDVLRYGLGYLEQQADAGDNTALQTRNNLRIMVAGGDGTVGWVLGTIGELEQNGPYKVPPVGIIPLGTGNDLSRSFKWGGSTTAVSRATVKRWLKRCVDAEIAKLDSWQLIVRPAPTRQDAPLKLPYAMHPQHHIPLEDPGSDHGDRTSPYFVGSFWNYFSIGMDAQVAYGFHHLRDEAPWLASGRVANQMVYGGYSCAQGWFCTPCAVTPVLRGLRQILKIYIKGVQDVDAKWVELELPPYIRALVILNVQSYAGGRNPWGRPSSKTREKEGFVEAKFDDGILEILGLRGGWHTTVVLLDWFSAVRLCQARGVKLELKGKAQRNKAYMQMDGEPWQQPLGEAHEPPAVVEIDYSPVQSICLLRK